MIIKERIVANLRKGDKNALEEIYNKYHPLYRFYFTYLLRNEKWVDDILPNFYNTLYIKIYELNDNYNFEFWSLMIIKKMSRDFFKSEERFTDLSPLDIQEILEAEYKFDSFIPPLDTLQSTISVFTHIYNLSISNTGKLLDKENSTIFLGKKTAYKELSDFYYNDWYNKLENAFLLNFDIKNSFNEISTNIEFKEKNPGSELKMQGNLKSMIIFVITIILLVLIFTIILKTGACTPQVELSITSLDVLMKVIKWG